MTQVNKVMARTITPSYLTSLDKSQLIDLLQQKTEYLVNVRAAKNADLVFIKTLQKEVEKIQEVIKSRMTAA